MKTCNDCIHCEVCVRQKIYGEYSITECKGHFLGKEDVVEVVRCKDCESCDSFYPCKAIGEEEPIRAYYCEKFERYRKPTDFCSYGVKRSDTE